MKAEGFDYFLNVDEYVEVMLEDAHILLGRQG